MMRKRGSFMGSEAVIFLPKIPPDGRKKKNKMRKGD